MIAVQHIFERKIFNFDIDLRPTFQKFLRIDQIVCEGEEFNLLSKDPAVNSIVPIAHIFPENSQQIKSILKLANQYDLKIWTYSTGKNWGYLNTAGSEKSIVLNLNRMNKIHLVDENLAYAVIEPGVTYKALSAFLEENNYNLCTDSPGGPPTGSVIGNALDRGIGVTKYGDHFAHLCGYEVILADGTTINTGVANDKNQSSASHLYKWGVGPYVEGLFSQSNFGIVVKAGIWLMRKPKDYSLFSLNIHDNERLAKGMDVIRELMLKGVLHETGRFSNDIAILTLVTQAYKEGFKPRETISRAELESLKTKYHVPGWTASFCIYGEKEIVDVSSKVAFKTLKNSKCFSKINRFSKFKAKVLIKIIQQMGKVKSKSLLNMFEFGVNKIFKTSLALLKLFPGLVDLHEGKPVETVVRRGYFRYPKQRPDVDIHAGRDDIGILWSVPILPFSGNEVVAFANKCEQLFEKYKFDFYMTTMIFNARSVCPLMVILYDRLNEIECNNAEKLYREILNLSHQMGYQHFRSGINGWDKLYQNCPELKNLNQKIKEALDPNHVLAPGRYGID